MNIVYKILKILLSDILEMKNCIKISCVILMISGEEINFLVHDQSEELTKFFIAKFFSGRIFIV